MLICNDEKLVDRINEFVKAADEVSAKEYADRGYTFAPPPKHRADYLSDKWVRVVTVEKRGEEWKDSGVYAFICIQDGETKALGKLKAGDIHKAAGFKAPAKHARGNVLNDDFRKAITAYGVVYLR